MEFVIEIWARALQRGLGECAVCICDNDSGAKTVVKGVCATGGQKMYSRVKPIAVLSCSHVLHDRCMRGYETYSKEDVSLCPICRVPYEKKILKFW